MEEKWWKLWSMILPLVLWRCWLGGRKGIRPVKTKQWGTGVVICLEWCADLHMAQLIPLTLTVSCFSKIQIGFTFLVPAHSGSPGKRPLNGGVCALVYDCLVREKLIIYSHHTTVCVSTSPSCRAWFPNTQRINRHIDKTQTYDAIQEPTFQQRTTKLVKVAHTRLTSVGFRSWSKFLAVSLQITWVINPAVGCHYLLPGLQLPPQPLRGLLPILLLGEQRHNGSEQFA